MQGGKKSIRERIGTSVETEPASRRAAGQREAALNRNKGVERKGGDDGALVAAAAGWGVNFGEMLAGGVVRRRGPAGVRELTRKKKSIRGEGVRERVEGGRE